MVSPRINIQQAAESDVRCQSQAPSSPRLNDFTILSCITQEGYDIMNLSSSVGFAVETPV